MPKLNQILALVGGEKGRAESVITKLYHMLQKTALLHGLTRVYRPKDEDNGEHLPPEGTRVQLRVRDAIQEARAAWTKLWNLVAIQDLTNTVATAEILIDGEVLVEALPPTHLLFLEKQLVDLHTFVSKLPTLDPAYQWTFDPAADCYATPQTETVRTKKVLRNHLQAPATKEHPAQVQVYTEDVIIGYWTKIEFDGGIPEKERNDMLARVRQLQDAVRIAREKANSCEVKEVSVAPLLEYVFRNASSGSS
jgi:hypothetical protein